MRDCVTGVNKAGRQTREVQPAFQRTGAGEGPPVLPGSWLGAVLTLPGALYSSFFHPAVAPSILPKTWDRPEPTPASGALCCPRRDSGLHPPSGLHGEVAKQQGQGLLPVPSQRPQCARLFPPRLCPAAEDETRRGPGRGEGGGSARAVRQRAAAACKTWEELPGNPDEAVQDKAWMELRALARMDYEHGERRPQPPCAALSGLHLRSGSGAGGREGGGQGSGVPTPEPSEGGRFVLHKQECKDKPTKTKHMGQGGRGGAGRAGPGLGRGTVLRAGWQCLSPEEAQLAWGWSHWLCLQTS